MASSRSTNTMDEFLRRMIGDISEAKTLPDADLEFLIGMETTILQKLRAPIDALQGQIGAQGSNMQGMQAPMGGAGGQMPPVPPMSGGPGVPGIRQEPQMPPVDELRRMLTR